MRTIVIRVVFALLATLISIPTVVGDETRMAEDTSPDPVDVIRLHALGLWFPSDLGEAQPGRDVSYYRADGGIGLSLSWAHQKQPGGFGIGVGGRLTWIPVEIETHVYGGLPPWGRIYVSEETLTVVEPFISLEGGSVFGEKNSFRFAGQIGYQISGRPEALSGLALSLEVGFCPTPKKPPRIRLDLIFRGTVVINPDREHAPSFLLGIGIGTNGRVG